MKRLRIGFATLVAIIAVGLTVAAQAGVFESKKTLVGTESDCFDIRTASPGAPIDILNGQCEIIQLDETDGCPGTALDGFGIFTDLTSHAVVTDADIDCPGSAQACCVEVEEDPQPCLDLDPPQSRSNLGVGLKYYQVKAVKCTLN